MTIWSNWLCTCSEQSRPSQVRITEADLDETCLYRRTPTGLLPVVNEQSKSHDSTTSARSSVDGSMVEGACRETLASGDGQYHIAVVPTSEQGQSIGDCAFDGTLSSPATTPLPSAEQIGDREVAFDCTDERVLNFRDEVVDHFHYCRADTGLSAPVLSEEEDSMAAREFVEKIRFDLSKGKMGVEVALYRDFLVIWLIKDDPTGLVRVYNETDGRTNPFGRVGRGDQIVQVEGELDPRNMMKLIKEARGDKQMITVTIRKRKRAFTAMVPPMKHPKLGIKCLVRDQRVFIGHIVRGVISTLTHHHPRHAICIGDEIEVCNGVTGGGIIEELTAWVETPNHVLVLSIIAKR